ncbi:hypothetical protein HPP92_006648 [Vanilla planifolia]|uniref:Uncharacterized protein n=1 Tax=Vanilla planifolia TaxID=51239 RepID=A0A835V727_VANPL|nr:hypothetical protein HPP92_006648 [Vanilla planifolia]
MSCLDDLLHRVLPSEKAYEHVPFLDARKTKLLVERPSKVAPKPDCRGNWSNYTKGAMQRSEASREKRVEISYFGDQGRSPDGTDITL